MKIITSWKQKHPANKKESIIKYPMGEKQYSASSSIPGVMDVSRKNASRMIFPYIKTLLMLQTYGCCAFNTRKIIKPRRGPCGKHGSKTPLPETRPMHDKAETTGQAVTLSQPAEEALVDNIGKRENESMSFLLQQ
ncbi:MAG: hypothetical protein LUE13_10590 [Akkermansiaceae bacterium]|nr:hypothetical protein [Akkermansiaceae bacterium]